MQDKDIKDEKKVVCIYDYADMDGICSAAIVFSKYPAATFFPYRYNEPIDWELFKDIADGQQDLHVIMVDMSFTPFNMYCLCWYTKNGSFTWIDHHKQAYDEFVETRENNSPMNQVSVVYSPNVAACQLVWNHLYPKDKIPYCVRQLSLYDIWKHDDPNTLPYQEGMRVLLDKSGHGTTPYAQKMWKDALQTKPRDSKSQLPPSTWDLMRIIEGLLILKFKKGEDSKYAAAYSFEFEWAVELPVSKPVDGNETYTQIYRVIALNRGMCGSPALDPVYNPHHDLKMFFCLKPNGLYKVSLRSDREEIDCAKIAKVYGGSGHKGAAGFSIKEPFWVPRKL